ncbi:hypothetical protein [Rhodococcus oxybenzonivorans]|nr:hypothetical protein [Rhodococcus oxybenzonivorans]
MPVSGTTARNGCLDDPVSGWFAAAASFTPLHLQLVQAASLS